MTIPQNNFHTYNLVVLWICDYRSCWKSSCSYFISETTHLCFIIIYAPFGQLRLNSVSVTLKHHWRIIASTLHKFMTQSNAFLLHLSLYPFASSSICCVVKHEYRLYIMWYQAFKNHSYWFSKKITVNI